MKHGKNGTEKVFIQNNFLHPSSLIETSSHRSTHHSTHCSSNRSTSHSKYVEGKQSGSHIKSYYGEHCRFECSRSCFESSNCSTSRSKYVEGKQSGGSKHLRSVSHPKSEHCRPKRPGSSSKSSDSYHSSI